MALDKKKLGVLVYKRASYKRAITNVFRNLAENKTSVSSCKHIIEKNIAFIEELDQSINYLYLVEQEEDFDEENIPDVHGIELDKQSDYHLSVVNQLSERNRAADIAAATNSTCLKSYLHGYT